MTNQKQVPPLGLKPSVGMTVWGMEQSAMITIRKKAGLSTRAEALGRDDIIDNGMTPLQIGPDDTFKTRVSHFGGPFRLPFWSVLPVRCAEIEREDATHEK